MSDIKQFNFLICLTLHLTFFMVQCEKQETTSTNIYSNLPVVVLAAQYRKLYLLLLVRLKT